MPPPGSGDRPLRVAVVGAGLYATEALLKNRTSSSRSTSSPLPDAVRAAPRRVAPDHQSIKAVARVLERILADRRMSIPGEDLPNSHPAISFVGWYNGHPDYRELPVDLACERAVVVGNGNVAMDVARIPATAPDELARPTSPTTPWRRCGPAGPWSRRTARPGPTSRSCVSTRPGTATAPSAASSCAGGHRLHHLPRLAGPGRPRAGPRGQPGTAPGQGLQRPGDAGGHPPRGLTGGHSCDHMVT